MVGHNPCDGFRKPDREAAKMNWLGCQTARFNAAPPDIDMPTAASPFGSMLLLLANQAGSSSVRKVSHL